MTDTIETPNDAPAEVRSETPPSLKPRTLAIAFVAALVACLLAYLAAAVPGRWISSGTDKGYGATQLTLPRGSATLRDNELVVSRAAEDGNTVISVTTDFRSADYPVIAWIAEGFPADARVALLWRTDVEPARVNRRAIEISAGRPLAVDVHDDPHWLGRVVGLALAVQGPIEQPLRVRAVIAKPADALSTLADRAREWIAPEPWTGASINTVIGGADAPRLPMTLLFAAAVAVAVALLWLVVRRSGRAALPALVASAAALTLVSWFILDARWVINLVAQTHATALQYAGKDNHAKHLAGEDRDLFAFIDKAKALLPRPPARVFVLADADFFRGRAAYHLYPHNVWYEPYRNAVPPADQLRAGDWLVVYQRRGVQYDSARRSLRWDGGVTVPADLRLLDRGGALFVVQ